MSSVNTQLMLDIGNNGELITSTNFWDLGIDRFYLSWNAGAARLLVPEIHTSHIIYMQMGTEIILCKHTIVGNAAFAILFDDHTDSPYVVQSSIEASDRTIDFTDSKDRRMYVYSKTGLEIEKRFSTRNRFF